MENIFRRKESPESQAPDFLDIKTTVEKEFSPEKIKEVRNMLKSLGYILDDRINIFDEDLQKALIKVQNQYGNNHPSILDVAVGPDKKTPLIINGRAQQKSYGILGNGLYQLLKEITGTRKQIDLLKAEKLGEAVLENQKLSVLSPEEQNMIFEKLGIHSTTSFESRSFADAVRSFQRHYDIFPTGILSKDDITWQHLMGVIPYEIGFQSKKMTPKQITESIAGFKKYDFFGPIRNEYSIDIDDVAPGSTGITCFGESDCSFPLRIREIFKDLYGYDGKIPVRTWFFYDNVMLGLFLPEGNGIYINQELMKEGNTEKLYEVLLNEGSHYFYQHLSEKTKKQMTQKRLLIGGELITTPNNSLEISELFSDITSSHLSYDAYSFCLNRTEMAGKYTQEKEDKNKFWTPENYHYSGLVMKKIRDLEVKQFGEDFPNTKNKLSQRMDFLRPLFRNIIKGFLGNKTTIDI